MTVATSVHPLDAPRSAEMTVRPGAKAAIAIVVSLIVICLLSLGLWMWWRRRQKQQLAKDMVNFVDGDIVNLVDGGRFEKPFYKPAGAYQSYYHGESSSSITPSPVYHQAPSHFTTPPVEQPSRNYNDCRPLFPAAVPASTPSLPPSRDMPPPSEPANVVPPLPAEPIVESHAWANGTRHPWSPPDYDAHSPVAESGFQEDDGFRAARHGGDTGGNKDHYPVVALPAVLPDPRPEPQAELPARDIHGWGHEQELPAPNHAPVRRQAPPHGNEFEEQKFLLSDVLSLREQKSKPNMRRDPAG